MAAPNLGQLAPPLVVLALLLFIITRRTYLQLRGAQYSPIQLFGFASFAALFFAVFAGTTLYTAHGTWGWPAWCLLAPYGATVAATALLAEPHVRRTVRFERRGDGLTYYRLPWLIPVLYLALFSSRLGVELALFGLASVGSPALPTSLPLGELLLVIGFDLLYAVSLGLLLARGMGTLRAFRAVEGSPSPPPASASDRPLA
jgi:hypothetical protein